MIFCLSNAKADRRSNVLKVEKAKSMDIVECNYGNFKKGYFSYKKKIYFKIIKFS